MTITLSELYEAAKALSELAQSNMPVKTAFRIAKLQRVFDEHLADAEKARLKLLDKYGSKDEKTGVTNVNPEHRLSFEAEIKQLFDVKVEVPDEKFTSDDLGDIQIKPVQLFMLTKFIC